MRRVAVVALSALALVLAGSTSAAQPRNDVKNFQHVFVIMMENTGYHQLIGDTTDAPWINAAAAQYGLATSYTGVTHPSQPNYIAATSGSTQGVANDDDTTRNVANIVDQLESHGKTWKAYMQSYSLCTAPTDHECGNQLYERKHNPFITYDDVRNDPARVAKIVDFSQFATDLANNTVPDYSWISPDQCNDMHGRGAGAADPCSYSNESLLIQAGDRFLADTVGAIQASRAWTGNSVIFVTWDESEYPFADTSGCCDANPGGGHVVTLVISHSDHAARQSDVAYNHYSLLRTIEDGWKLGCLDFTCDTANVPAMTDLVGPKG